MIKVPGFLKAGLTSMLDNLIINNVYQGYPVVDQITGIVQGIAEVSKYMEVHDTITLHKAASDGTVKVDQQLDAVGFRLFGVTQVVPLPAASLPQALAHMNGQLTPHNDAPVADADLTIEAGTYSLPVGSLMLKALGPLLFSQFGGAIDLAGALKNMVPCADFGQLLVDNSGGLLTDPTVGKGLCEGALDIAAKAVTQQIGNVTLDGIQVDGTSAQLFDVSMKSPKMDYQSDRLAQGAWTWHFDVSGGTAAVPSTFAGGSHRDRQLEPRTRGGAAGEGDFAGRFYPPLDGRARSITLRWHEPARVHPRLQRRGGAAADSSRRSTWRPGSSTGSRSTG